MRHVGCHSECQPYRAYEAENSVYREERRKLQQTSDAINQIKNHCIRSVTHSQHGEGWHKEVPIKKPLGRKGPAGQIKGSRSV